MSSSSGAWERVQDAHGRVFYVNHATREVRESKRRCRAPFSMPHSLIHVR